MFTDAFHERLKLHTETSKNLSQNGFKLRVKRHLDGFFAEKPQSPTVHSAPENPLNELSPSALDTNGFRAAFKALTDNPPAAQSAPDPVRLGERGWKQRYYKEKFGFSVDTETALQTSKTKNSKTSVQNPPRSKPQPMFLELLSAYMRGLEWVYGYYNDQCLSWNWFYPFHYAPFASDLARLASWNRGLDRGKPFAPLAQLMAVMPPSSSHCLPPQLAALMCDATGPLADFYPADFALDLNGKRFAWQGVALLPFIDEERLLRCMAPCMAGLSAEEGRRNVEGRTLLFVRREGEFFRGLEEGFLRAERRLSKRVARSGEIYSEIEGKNVEKSGEFKENDIKNTKILGEKSAEKQVEKNLENPRKKSPEKLEKKTLKKQKALKKAKHGILEIKSPFPAVLPGRIAKPNLSDATESNSILQTVPVVAELFYRPRHLSSPNFSGLLRGARPPERALSASDFSLVVTRRRFGSFRPDFLLKHADPAVLNLFRRYDPSLASKYYTAVNLHSQQQQQFQPYQQHYKNNNNHNNNQYNSYNNNSNIFNPQNNHNNGGRHLYGGIGASFNGPIFYGRQRPQKQPLQCFNGGQHSGREWHPPQADGRMAGAIVSRGGGSIRRIIKLRK